MIYIEYLIMVSLIMYENQEDYTSMIFQSVLLADTTYFKRRAQKSNEENTDIRS